MLVEQGDFIEVDFNPTLGHEPQKLRPALVVSTGYFNNVLSSLVVVCPITTAAHSHPLHIRLPEDSPVQGSVCVESMRAIDIEAPSRHTSHLGAAIDASTMGRVLEAIAAVFGV